MQFNAKYNDGIIAKSYTLVCIIKQNYLVGVDSETKKRILDWNLNDIKIEEVHKHTNSAVILNKKNEDERLYINLEFYNYLRKFLPSHKNINIWDIKREGVYVLSALAVFIVFFIYFSLDKLSGVMLQFIPESVEFKIGEVVKDQFIKDYKVCNNIKGLTALYKLQNSLKYNNSELLKSLEIIVVKEKKISNALASPGNKIIIFSKLIKDADTEAEIAGVLAHEIGHLHYGHSMRALSRLIVSSYLFSVMMGDLSSVAYIAGALNDISYSKDNEKEADAFASEILNASNIGNLGAINFFKRTIIEEKSHSTKLPEYLSTHPNSFDRIKFFEENNKVSNPIKILSDNELKDLKNICKK
jgi:predicted Zn-dependent protease